MLSVPHNVAAVTIVMIWDVDQNMAWKMAMKHHDSTLQKKPDKLY